MIAFLKNLFGRNKKIKNVSKPKKYTKSDKINDILNELEGVRGIEIRKDKDSDGMYGIAIDASQTDITPEMVIRMIERRLKGDDND